MEQPATTTSKTGITDAPADTSSADETVDASADASTVYVNAPADAPTDHVDASSHVSKIVSIDHHVDDPADVSKTVSTDVTHCGSCRVSYSLRPCRNGSEAPYPMTLHNVVWNWLLTEKRGRCPEPNGH